MKKSFANKESTITFAGTNSGCGASRLTNSYESDYHIFTISFLQLNYNFLQLLQEIFIYSIKKGSEMEP